MRTLGGLPSRRQLFGEAGPTYRPPVVSGLGCKGRLWNRLPPGSTRDSRGVVIDNAPFIVDRAVVIPRLYVYRYGNLNLSSSESCISNTSGLGRQSDTAISNGSSISVGFWHDQRTITAGECSTSGIRATP